MKNVENKKMSIAIEQFDEATKSIVIVNAETNYFEVFYESCKRPAQKEGGYSWEMIEKINRVKKVYEDSKTKVGEKIKVEDADFEFIKERVLSNTWSTFDESLLELKKYLEKL